MGGDARQVYLARSIARDGYSVFMSCLEKAEEEELPQCGPEDLVQRCGIILLPLPVTRDGKRLNTPLSDREILLNDSFASLFAGRRVYGGLMERLLSTSELWESSQTFDYYTREELVLGNAFLTAEGAIGMAISQYEGALNGSHCLVTGFGRIGKALCLALRGLGVRVDCCARKAADLTAIRGLGCEALSYRQLTKPYDIIFNTVPARVLSALPLSHQSRETLIIELASPPGGIDMEVARRLGLRVVDGQSLPGKVSPKTSGELIKEAVYNMMEEL